MSSTTPATFPDDYRAPLVLVDQDHHGAWIHVCNAFGLLVVLITLAIRGYIRTKVSPPLRYDDITLAAATGLAIVQSCITFEQVHRGFGTSMKLLSEAQLVQIQELSYTADIFYVLAIYVSKCSVVLLFMRMVADRMHRTVAWSMLAGCCTLGLISLLLTALGCNLSHPWLVYNHVCSSLKAESSVVAAFDVITELAIFSISIILVWGLHTKASNKSRVVIAFGIRLPVVVPILLRQVYLATSLDSLDPTLSGTFASILTQIELFYGIMAATVPCLRPFLAGFITNYGAMGRETIIGGSQIGSGSKKDQDRSKTSNIVLSSLNSSRNRASALREKFRRSGSEMLSEVSDLTQDEPYRPVHGLTETTITRGSNVGGNDAGSIVSNDSARVMIKKEVQLTVGREEGAASQLRVPGSG